MSYEEIDKMTTNSDVFTGGAEGRYAKAKSTTNDGENNEKRKRTMKNEVADLVDEEKPKTKKTAAENTNVDSVETKKTKKKLVEPSPNEKSEKIKEKETNNENETVDSVETKKPKKKLDEPNSNEKSEKVKEKSTINGDEIKSSKKNISSKTENDELSKEKTKKNRAPKAPKAPNSTDEQNVEPSELETVEKVRRPKKNKAPTIPIETIEKENFPVEIQEAVQEQVEVENKLSDHQQLIKEAFDNLSSNVNFSEFLNDDQWKIVFLPKSARTQNKSVIRKILPGQKENRQGVSKPNLTKRIFSNFSNLVRDENNLLFGERFNYDVADESEEDEIDTDGIHRVAQKLRQVEDEDREFNPEFLVIQDGEVKFGVHEPDDDGNVKLSKRKPILDRAADRSIQSDEQGKRKLFGFLKLPFGRNKEKNDERTLEAEPKRQSRKTNKKTDNVDALTNE